jgi:hypothetical protein
MPHISLIALSIFLTMKCKVICYFASEMQAIDVAVYQTLAKSLIQYQEHPFQPQHPSVSEDGCDRVDYQTIKKNVPKIAPQ